MAYLKKSDYTLRIGVEHLDEILEQATESSGLSTDNILHNAESWAIATVKSYLSSQYDIGAEYQKEATDETRNFLIMQVTIDLVLCTIHKTINPRDLPEHIEKGCIEAVEWLKTARDGLVSVDLPPKVTPGEKTYHRTHLASQVKFISRPYEDARLFDNPPTEETDDENA